MDRDILERRLTTVERRITELEYHAEGHRSIIAGLEAAGRADSETAEVARDLLRTTERNLRCEIADRKWLRTQLRHNAPRV